MPAWAICVYNIAHGIILSKTGPKQTFDFNTSSERPISDYLTLSLQYACYFLTSCRARQCLPTHTVTGGHGVETGDPPCTLGQKLGERRGSTGTGGDCRGEEGTWGTRPLMTEELTQMVSTVQLSVRREAHTCMRKQLHQWKTKNCVSQTYSTCMYLRLNRPTS